MPSRRLITRAPGPWVSGSGSGKKPGASKAPEPDTNEVVEIGKIFKAFEGKASEIPGSWPTFRGAAYDNISTEPVKLLERWPAAGPKVLWSLDLGMGYAGAAIHKGRVYVLDYDETAKEDALRCFSLDDGKEIWRLSYKVMIKQYHGFSRTVPAVSDRYVVTIGQSRTLIPDFQLCDRTPPRTNGNNQCKRGWGSFHASNVMNFALTDGSVRGISPNIEMNSVMPALGSIAGSETVRGDF